MIVLDASVVIAHFAAGDVHHAAATSFLRERLEHEFVVHSMTMTEILVGPMRIGRQAFAEHQLAALGIVEWSPPAGSAARLARLRVDSALKLPDCCVLDAAMMTSAPMATLDARLAGAAASVGVPVIDLT